MAGIMGNHTGKRLRRCGKTQENQALPVDLWQERKRAKAGETVNAAKCLLGLFLPGA
jgi:hypothetical protein